MTKQNEDNSQESSEDREPHEIDPSLRGTILWETGVDPVELREEVRRREA